MGRAAFADVQGSGEGVTLWDRSRRAWFNQFHTGQQHAPGPLPGADSRI